MCPLGCQTEAINHGKGTAVGGGTFGTPQRLACGQGQGGYSLMLSGGSWWVERLPCRQPSIEQGLSSGEPSFSEHQQAVLMGDLCFAVILGV